MTREEAKRKLEFFKKAYQKLIDEKVDSGKLVGDGVRGEWKAGTSLDEVYKDAIKALDMAIEALEQQPSEDCISRKAILKYIEGSEADLWHDLENEVVRQYIKELPSVIPQQEVEDERKTEN